MRSCGRCAQPATARLRPKWPPSASRRSWRGRSTSSRTRSGATSTSFSTPASGSSMPRRRASPRAVGPTSMPLRRPCAERSAGSPSRRARSSGRTASKTTLTRIAETLRTAATAPDGRELLARGRLSEELSGTGWEIVAGFAPSPRARSKPADRKQAEEPDDTAERRAAEIEAQVRRVRELKKSLAAAEKRRRTASRQERAAAERLEELRAARSDADAEVESLGDEIAERRAGARELRRDREVSRRRRRSAGAIVRGSPSREEARAAPTPDPASTAARRCRTAARRARSRPITRSASWRTRAAISALITP